MRYKERPSEQSRFYALFHAAVEAIVVIDDDGSISNVNPAFEQLFGYSADEVIGQNVSMLMPEPDRSQHDSYIAHHRRSGETKIIGIGREVTAQHKQGHLFPIYLSVGGFQTPAIKGYVGILRDLRHIKETERELQQTTAELERTLQYAPVAIFTLHADGSIQKANRAAQAMLQLPEGLPTSIQALTAVDDQPKQQALLAALWAEGAGANRQCKLQYRGHSGQDKLMCEGHYAVVAAPDGSPAFIILELADLTPLINAELAAASHRESLALAGRVGSLGEMAASIAHELNQPLAAITLYAQTAKRMLAAGKNSDDLLNKIVEQSQRAGKVITQIRTLISAETQAFEPLDLRAVAREALRLGDVDARSLGLSLVSELDGEPLWVKGDAVQLQQVVLNLLRNAFDALVEHQSQGPLVDIHASSINHEACICVSDNGPGVSEEILPKLFEPFTTAKINGMGIGLSLSQSIAKNHGGILEHLPTASTGACFRLRLPLLAHSPED